MPTNDKPIEPLKEWSDRRWRQFVTFGVAFIMVAGGIACALLGYQAGVQHGQHLVQTGSPSDAPVPKHITADDYPPKLCADSTQVYMDIGKLNASCYPGQKMEIAHVVHCRCPKP